MSALSIGQICTIDCGEYLGETVRVIAIDGDSITATFADRNETVTLSAWYLA